MSERPFFLRKLFSEKIDKNPIIETSIPVKKYRVINGSDVEDMEEPEFSIAHWVSEDIYRKDLEESKVYLEEFKNTGTIKKYPYESLDDIPKYYDLNQKIRRFEDNYMDSGNHVSVIETPEGKYRSCTNGRHRLYVAKKYNLDIMVYVESKELA